MKLNKKIITGLLTLTMIGALNVLPNNSKLNAFNPIKAEVVHAYPSNPAYPGYELGVWMASWYDYNVEMLQYRLTSVGYSTFGVDGYFGNNTKNAVMNYQRDHGLTIDGIVGPATWNDLFN